MRQSPGRGHPGGQKTGRRTSHSGRKRVALKKPGTPTGNRLGVAPDYPAGGPMVRTALGLALVLMLGVGSSAAPITLGPRYKDESNGFQIQVPDKWDQVPTKFQEVALVGKWSGRAKRGGI